MEDTAPAPPQPTAEHKALEAQVGTWKVDCTFYMDPSQPPMQLEAKETVEMFGGFWTISLFESNMFGAPFQGRATLGYDNKIGKYVSTWVDTMSPQLFHLTGNYDAAGKVLEMSGEGIDCRMGVMTQYRTTEEAKDDGSRVFEMFMTMPDGNEIKLFHYVYTRA